MRRTRLAPAFVTTVLTSGCAWTPYGGGAHYAQNADNPNAFGAIVRGTWGVGGDRNALCSRATSASGSTHTGGVWLQTCSHIEWASLLGRRISSPTRRRGAHLGGHARDVAGHRPRDLGELSTASRSTPRPATATAERSSAWRLQAGYDAASDVGPMMVLAVTVTRDGTVPFGNPPPPPIAVAPRHTERDGD